MRHLYLAAITLACLSGDVNARERFPILNTQSCQCGPDCDCTAGECGDDACTDPSEAAPLRTALREAKPVRRAFARLAAVVENRPKLLRRFAARVFRRGCR